MRIIGLDSTVPGSHHGHVDDAGLEWLATTLAKDSTKPTLLMLHHPPFVSGIGFMDEYRYFNGSALGAVVSRFDNVEIVLCGLRTPVHAETLGEHRGVRLPQHRNGDRSVARAPRLSPPATAGPGGACCTCGMSATG